MGYNTDSKGYIREYVPGVAVHFNSLSWFVGLSVISAGTMRLLNTTSFTVGQQASRTYAARDTMRANL